MANHHKSPTSASYDPPIVEYITSGQSNQNIEVLYTLKETTSDDAEG
jgi:hypothetical protein